MKGLVCLNYANELFNGLKHTDFSLLIQQSDLFRMIKMKHLKSFFILMKKKKLRISICLVGNAAETVIMRLIL